MVIVLTSNYDAALLQMAVQMKNEFKKIYGEAVAFVPNQSKTDEKTDIERYERVNSLNPNFLIAVFSCSGVQGN